ncbi:hypothetical protein CRG86_017690 [Photobacterium leiognathi]|nr:hypothetical protein CRG86_017690 [Photobacterium leiognathi]
MKEIKFCYTPDNLTQTAIYLSTQESFPLFKKSVDEIEDVIKNSIAKTFERKFSKKSISYPYEIATGELHGAAVWRGVHCTFSSVESTNCPTYTKNLNIESECDLGIVAFDLHITLGDGVEIRQPSVTTRQEIQSLINKVEGAKSNYEKGKYLESLGASLLSLLTGYRYMEVILKTKLKKLTLLLRIMIRVLLFQKKGQLSYVNVRTGLASVERTNLSYSWIKLKIVTADAVWESLFLGMGFVKP